MDFGEENENAISKGPFYGAAAFIFLILVLFASVGLQENGTLYHWEIATCLLGTGLISILLFLPHFLQKIVDQLNDNGSQAHSELTQKAIFEVKELRSDLDSIALKIDKVPTLVDQIVRESINSTSDPSDRIVDQIQAIQQEINTKLDRLEETSLASPLPPETDPKIESLHTKTEELYELLQKALSKLATIEQAQLTESRSLPKNTNTDKVAISPSSLDELIPEPEVPIDPSKSEIPEDFLEEKQKVPQDDESTYELSDSEYFSESDLPDEVDLLSEETKDDILDRDSSSSASKESIDEPEDSTTPELEDQDEVSVVETELDLGLPDPAETLRKVDALLAGEDPSPKTQPAVTKEDKTEKNGTTTVVANVMIGIGNKPYLRGEGPGLSWDEGVAMNFIEIGKWAWSPSRKNASLTVQVYRNDQDPDQGGKVEIRPGEKIEITPEFS
jgi:hypothetical protein